MRALASPKRKLSLIAAVIAAGAFTLTVTESRAGVAYEGNTLRLLSIGINDYSGQWLDSVKFAVADAEAVAATFRQPATVKAFSGIDVTVLRDKEATLARVKSELHRIADQSSPGDTFLLYFAGQGRAELDNEGGLQYVFALADTLWPRAHEIRGGLSSADLAVLLRGIPAGNEIAIFDSYDSSSALEAVYAALNESRMSLFRHATRRFALLGIDGPSPELPKLGHGLMTYALLFGMAGEADADHDGVITSGELEAYLTWKLPKIVRQYWPDLVAFGGPFTRSYEPEIVNLVSRSNLRELPLRISGSAQRGVTLDLKQSQNELVSDNERGKDYAIIFAGDDYQYWPKLHNPLFDGATLKSELETNYGYAEAKLLANPTQDEVLDTLEKEATHRFSDRDRLLLYFAGHGDYEESTKMGYLVARDSQLSEKDPHRKTMIAFSTIRDEILNYSAGHILVVLDVCYGGTFDRRIAEAGTRGNTSESLPLDERIRRKLRDKSRIYLTSGGVRAAYDGEPGQHSPFARAFLTILRHYGGDSRLIDMDEIRHTLKTTLMPEPMSGPFDPRDVYGDFFFVAREHATPVLDPSLAH